jgi:hypothetical protein
MEIGAVLLRNVVYVWEQRTAYLMRNSIVLTSVSNKERTEEFLLDGSFVCESIVVSSAHMHSIRIRDELSEKEWIMDMQTHGRKQVWLDLFGKAKKDRKGDGSAKRNFLQKKSVFESDISKQLLQQVFDILPHGKYVKGNDIFECLEKDNKLNMSKGEISIVGEKLVKMKILAPICCCPHHFSSEKNVFFRVKDSWNIKSEEIDRASSKNRSEIQDVFDDMIFIMQTKEIGKIQEGRTILFTGKEAIRVLLENGALKTSVAIDLIYKMIECGLIKQNTIEDVTTTEGLSFSDEKFVATFALNVTESKLSHAQEKGNSIKDDNGSLIEKKLTFKLEEIEKKYEMMLRFLWVFCSFILFDTIFSSAITNPIKLTIIMGFLLWMVLNIKCRSMYEMEAESQTKSQAESINPTFATVSSLGDSSPSSSTSKSSVLEKSDDTDDLIREKSPPSNMIPEPIESFLTTKILSFRESIAHAGSMRVDSTYIFSDDYLHSILNVKDRSFGHAVEKMRKCLEWRQSYGVETTTLQDVNIHFENGSMYWYGYDFENRPILWVRPKLKDWKHMSSIRENEIRAHVYMIEVGCKYFMPPGVTTFTLVADAARLGPREVDLRLMHGLLDVCVAYYPDRIGILHVGPLNYVLKSLTRLLWPFIPLRLRNKLDFMKNCKEELSKHVPHDFIPTYMGGSVDHVLVSSLEEKKGFDFDYMIKQQKQWLPNSSTI